MGNLPSCCGIISNHVYPLELPKMAPFCMKITKNNSGGGPKYPLKNNSFKYYNIHVYAHAHTEPGSVQKIKKNHMKNPVLVLAPIFFFFFFCFFKILLRIKIKSLALVYLKINFLVELMLNNI